MREISDCGGGCGCRSRSPVVISQLLGYNPGVLTNVPTPPAQDPNTLGIVPPDPMLRAICYPDSDDGSGETFDWNIKLGKWV